MELTQSERIALIKNAHLATQGTSNALVDNFVEEVKTEQVISENGLFNVANVDIEDEKKFLNSHTAEYIDEEDQDVGISDEMKESLGLSTERVYEEEGEI
jgi:ABC-type proline/glycine betaine transport system ATPase subunit